MENRIGHLFGGSNMEEQNIPDIDVELEPNEALYLVEIGLDIEDEDDEPIISQLVVREREYQTLTKILTYNKISFMTTPLL